jgi:hypothetical protein
VIVVTVLVLFIAVNLQPSTPNRDEELRQKAETMLDINRFPTSAQSTIRNFINRHHPTAFNNSVVTLGYGNEAVKEYFIILGREAKPALNDLYVRHNEQTRVGGFSLGFGAPAEAAPALAPPPQSTAAKPVDSEAAIRKKAEAALDIRKFGEPEQRRLRAFVSQNHEGIYADTIAIIGYNRSGIDKYFFELGARAKDQLNQLYVDAGVKSRVGGVTLGRAPAVKRAPVTPAPATPAKPEPAPLPEPAPEPAPAPRPGLEATI